MRLCPVCAHRLEPHGSGGLTCAEGHAFTTSEITPLVQAITAVQATTKRPWLPGAVLGGLALAAELVRVLIGG